jgi:hypothetical protein
LQFEGIVTHSRYLGALRMPYKPREATITW